MTEDSRCLVARIMHGGMIDRQGAFPGLFPTKSTIVLLHFLRDTNEFLNKIGMSFP